MSTVLCSSAAVTARRSSTLATPITAAAGTAADQPYTTAQAMTGTTTHATGRV